MLVMANTWSDKPRDVVDPHYREPLLPPKTDRRRSQSMTSSAYIPLRTLQPEFGPPPPTAFSRPRGENRCSLPPIRDLLEVAQLNPATSASQLPRLQALSPPGGESVPRTLPPAFFEPSNRQRQESAQSSPSYQIRPTTSWPSQGPPPPSSNLAPLQTFQSAPASLQIDPALTAMDGHDHRKSFASTASASSARSAYSRTSYSASSPEGSTATIYPSIPSYPPESSLPLQRPLPPDYNPYVPALQHSASAPTPVSPQHPPEAWQQQHPEGPPPQQQRERQPRPPQPAYSVTSTSSQERYLCQECGRGFSRPSSLQIHSNTHTGNKPYMCPVPNCGKRFSVRSNMRRHEKGCHAAQAQAASAHRELLPMP